MKRPFAERIKEVEEAEGRPFAEVLAELSLSGKSKSSAAAILDLPQTSLCQWLRKNTSVGIDWPKKGQSNGFMANVLNDTPARQAARRENIKKAFAAKNKPS